MTLPQRIAAVLLAGLLAAGASGAGAQLLQPPRPTPDAQIKAAKAEVLAILKHDRAAGRVSEFAALVENLILPRFDFQRMTRIALERHWALATTAQQQGLVTQFRATLARTYSTALASYRDQEIEYRPLRLAAEHGDVVVRSLLRGPGAAPLTIDYDMRDGAAGWQIFDVSIDGVSLAMNYRDTFDAVIRTAGIGGLILALQERNRRGEARADARIEPLPPLRASPAALP